MVFCIRAHLARFFYSIIAFLEIVGFFITLQDFPRQSKSLAKHVLTIGCYLAVCIFYLPKLAMFIIQLVVYQIPMGIFRCCLPTGVKSRVRFVRRCTVKVGVGLEQKIGMEMSASKSMVVNRVRPNKRYVDGEGKAVHLANFLEIYDMLILITRELHYTDMIMLARTSKCVREAVLPAYDYDRRLELFKLYSCYGHRHECWLCAKQVCKACIWRTK